MTRLANATNQAREVPPCSLGPSGRTQGRLSITGSSRCAPRCWRLTRSNQAGVDKPALERPPPRRQKKASVGADPRLLSPRGKARPRRRKSGPVGQTRRELRRGRREVVDSVSTSRSPARCAAACLRRARRSLGGAAGWTCVRPSNNTHTRLGTCCGVTGNQTRWLDKGQCLAYGWLGWAACEQERT